MLRLRLLLFPIPLEKPQTLSPSLAPCALCWVLAGHRQLRQPPAPAPLRHGEGAHHEAGEGGQSAEAAGLRLLAQLSAKPRSFKTTALDPNAAKPERPLLGSLRLGAGEELDRPAPPKKTEAPDTIYL